MAEFEIEYIHNGAHRVAIILADDHRDAYQAFESMKSNGVLLCIALAIAVGVSNG